MPKQERFLRDDPLSQKWKMWEIIVGKENGQEEYAIEARKSEWCSGCRKKKTALTVDVSPRVGPTTELGNNPVILYISPGLFLMSSSSWVAIAKYYRLGGCKKQKSLSHHFEG